MLSFEVKKSKQSQDPDELEIYCDLEGLDSLLAQLHLLREGSTDHLHLMSGSWGGTHLDDRVQRPTNLPIHHVTILLRSLQPRTGH